MKKYIRKKCCKQKKRTNKINKAWSLAQRIYVQGRNARVQPNQMLWKVLKKIRIKRSRRAAYTRLYINKLVHMRSLLVDFSFYTLFIQKKKEKYKTISSR